MRSLDITPQKIESNVQVSVESVAVDLKTKQKVLNWL